MKLKKHIKKQNITQVKFAEIEKTTPQAVTQWINAGYFVRKHKGKYQMCKVMRELS